MTKAAGGNRGTADGCEQQRARAEASAMGRCSPKPTICRGVGGGDDEGCWWRSRDKTVGRERQRASIELGDGAVLAEANDSPCAVAGAGGYAQATSTTRRRPGARSAVAALLARLERDSGGRCAGRSDRRRWKSTCCAAVPDHHRGILGGHVAATRGRRERAARPLAAPAVRTPRTRSWSVRGR